MNTSSDSAIFSLYKDQPIYQDLLQDFVSCLDERIDLGKKAIEEGSWKELSRVMHSLRGAAATYGYPGLAEIAASIELASLEPNVRQDLIHSAFESVCSTCQRMVLGVKAMG